MVKPRHYGVFLLTVWTSGCCFSPERVRGPLAVVAAATLACDWSETRALASAGWRSHTEANPILGTNPTPGELDLYFLAAGAVIATGVYLIPDKYDWILLGLVTAVQTKALVYNTLQQVPLCGLYDNRHTK